ncbi:MAG: LysR substrate-binding domain-containing protein [Planctomycetota bacterium]
MRPSLRQLEYLVAVAETLHFRKAAQRCAVTQPALSAQIQSLEQLLGVQLFERNRRRVLLTTAGREAVGRAREVLERVDALAEAARAAAEPLSGELRLGVIPTVAPYLLPRVLPGLRESHPNLRLFLREEMTPVIVDRLNAGELDCLLLALPVTGGDFDSQLLFLDSFWLALPEGHPLLSRTSVAEDDLRDQEVLLLEDGHCLRDQALAICSRNGASESMRVRATSLGTLVQMVSGGLGLTLLPEIAVDVEARDGSGVELRPFVEPVPQRQIGLVWRKGSSRAEEFKQLGEEIVALLDQRAAAR